MRQLASTIAPLREMQDHKFCTLVGRAPLYSQPPPRPGLITKIAGILAIVITSAFVTDMIAPSKFGLSASMRANSSGAQVEHILVDGVHMAIPMNLAHVPVEDLVPMP